MVVLFIFRRNHCQASELQLTDDSIKVEFQILAQVSGPAAVTKFADKLRENLPSKTVAVDPVLALQRVQAMIASDIYRLAPRSAQGLATHCQELLAALVSEMPVKVNIGRSDEVAGIVQDIPTCFFGQILTDI